MVFLEKEQELKPQQETETEKPPEPKKKKAVKIPPSRQKKRHISGYFTEEAHKQLRLIGFEEDKSIQEMLTEMLNNYFTIHDKPPIA